MAALRPSDSVENFQYTKRTHIQILLYRYRIILRPSTVVTLEEVETSHSRIIWDFSLKTIRILDLLLSFTELSAAVVVRLLLLLPHQITH